MLKNELIYPNDGIENELMITIVKHQYYYYLDAIIAYNDVQHSHNQQLDIHDELVLVILIFFFEETKKIIVKILFQ